MVRIPHPSLGLLPRTLRGTSRARARFIIAAVLGCAGFLAPTTQAALAAPTQAPTTTTPQTPPTGAAPGETTTTTTPPPKPPPAPPAPTGAIVADGRNARGEVLSISDVLKDVPATSLEYDAAIAKRDRTAAELESQRSKFGAAQAEIASVSAQMPAVTTLLARARARISKLTAATDRARTKARELAVARFVGGTSTALIPNPLRTVDETLDDSQRIRLLVEARNRLTAAQDSAEASLAAAREFTATLSGELDNMEATKARATSALEAAAAEITRLEPLLAATEHSIVLARSGAAVADSDLPLVALDAYWRASKAMEKLAPACQIPWWALAGIGRTESNHGRYGGAEVEPYGRVTIPIIGIALDGTRNTRRIPDTDKGLLDGDTVVDRAVGVMQFIPGTWKRWGSDGSGDKVSDPQNIYDAALSSARYLCSYGPGLNQPAVLAKAFFGYNHSQSYVDTVAARANAYALLPVPLAVPVA